MSNHVYTITCCHVHIQLSIHFFLFSCPFVYVCVYLFCKHVGCHCSTWPLGGAWRVSWAVPCFAHAWLVCSTCAWPMGCGGPRDPHLCLCTGESLCMSQLGAIHCADGDFLFRQWRHHAPRAWLCHTPLPQADTLSSHPSCSLCSWLSGTISNTPQAVLIGPAHSSILFKVLTYIPVKGKMYSIFDQAIYDMLCLLCCVIIHLMLYIILNCLNSIWGPFFMTFQIVLSAGYIPRSLLYVWSIWLPPDCAAAHLQVLVWALPANVVYMLLFLCSFYVSSMKSICKYLWLKTLYKLTLWY